MDSGILVVLLLLMYVVPEIWKRMKKPKQPYQYPELPGQQGGATGIPGALSKGVRPPELPAEVAAPPVVATLAAVPFVDNSYPQADLAPVAQGIVWAEIFAPPVAIRLKRNGGRIRNGLYGR